jgi:hypothetical protein
MDTNQGNLETIDRRRKKAKAKGINGNGFGMTLGEMANRGMLPTPTTRDYRSSGSQAGYHKRKGKHVQALNEAMAWGPNGVGFQGMLNPQFVEEIMGFPIGWTELKPSGTQ